MGANLSRVYEGDDGRPPAGYPGLADIPENCIAGIFRHLSPLDICKLARLNRAFKGAASSDLVWAEKLPVCYQDMLSKLPLSKGQFLPKKEIYALLCKPISLDNGTKEVWLDKATGGVCLAISARAMAITGIDDHRYWRWIPCEESRFHEIAYLQQLWWFEVDGVVKFQLPAGEYSLSFRLRLGTSARRLGRRVQVFNQVHGWDLKPVQFCLSTSDGQHATRGYYLDQAGEDGPVGDARGKWTDYHVGNFVVENENKLTEVKFSMTQIDCTHSKGGLSLDSVSIVPSKLQKETEVCKYCVGFYTYLWKSFGI
ncbi:F-box protein PP2-A15 isoform X1 [Cryptomeria japonica]|uniref:F-box protein PP2-A15 isoform X1 n=1 Tax=Cryptomeria japonica TaxID=3369 RepID=UPI0025AC4EBC|nr:F-box protein PP2-A15 isoform X1 [Cryptomeria japonica]